MNLQIRLKTLKCKCGRTADDRAIFIYDNDGNLKSVICWHCTKDYRPSIKYNNKETRWGNR